MQSNNYLEVDSKLREDIIRLIEVNTPIICIRDFDYARIDAVLNDIIGESKVLEWNPITGTTRFDNKEGYGSDFQSLVSLLEEKYRDELYTKKRYLILKEIHRELEDARVCSALSFLSQRRLYDRRCETTVIIILPYGRIPQEIETYVSYIEPEYPSDKDIDIIINQHIEANDYVNEFKDEYRETLKLSLRGMSRYDIDRVLDMAMSNNGTLTAQDKEMILKQKKQMVKKSGLMELIDVTVSLDDIGGLNSLKKYFEEKAAVLKDWINAHKYGVKISKGVFIVGMPGCGKSLCAKAAAKALDMPLLKLDIGSMMGKYVGQSEENLRKAIRIAEAAAPCVLWIDEIEKALSGSDGKNDVLTRMFGHFLSWMQEKTSTVYVIATANKADDLPPELKRKGRFDEIFCVNLPNLDERQAIFKVHIGKVPPSSKVNSFNWKKLAEATNGFNGADIESVVNDSVEHCFRNNKKTLDTNILLEIIRNTVSITKSCKEQIDSMKKVFEKSSFKDATTGKLTAKG